MSEQQSSWRPVVGFESLYEVSDTGEVRRIGKAHRCGKGRGGSARLGRPIKPQKHRGGYLAVQLWRLGKMHRPLLHRVVAAAFIGPCPEGMEVNHIDGVKTNNAASNLEYVDRSQNMLHAYRTGLRVVSEVTRENARRMGNIYGKRNHEAGIGATAVGRV